MVSVEDIASSIKQDLFSFLLSERRVSLFLWSQRVFETSFKKLCEMIWAEIKKEISHGHKGIKYAYTKYFAFKLTLKLINLIKNYFLQFFLKPIVLKIHS